MTTAFGALLNPATVEARAGGAMTPSIMASGLNLEAEEALARAMTEAAAEEATRGRDGDGDGEGETRESGHVKWRVYRTYGESVGRWTVALVLSSLLLMQVGA